MDMKRVVTIQDLSCIGRCSLGVAMAVLPAMGIETAALPTALLSAHTQFEGFTFLDLTDEAEKIMAHWQKLNIRFDTIYIGYLGSVRLVRMASRFIHIFRAADTRVIIDPAFGDNGRLYTGFDLEYVARVRELCAQADVILPNATEACYLVGMEYGNDASATREIIRRAGELLSGDLKNVLITSCRFADDQTGLACIGKNAFAYPHALLPYSLQGSGDLFASVFAGMITLDRDIEAAARIAADFTYDTLEYSMHLPDRRWYGLDFEPMLAELIKRI